MLIISLIVEAKPEDVGKKSIKYQYIIDGMSEW